MAIVESDLIPEGLAFDDVLLRPGLSAVMPSATDIGTQLTRTIRLNLPIISAAMDTVTEARTAIAMAQSGGLGFIHKNLTPAQQALEAYSYMSELYRMTFVSECATMTTFATVSEQLGPGSGRAMQPHRGVPRLRAAVRIDEDFPNGTNLSFRQIGGGEDVTLHPDLKWKRKKTKTSEPPDQVFTYAVDFVMDDDVTEQFALIREIRGWGGVWIDALDPEVIWRRRPYYLPSPDLTRALIHAGFPRTREMRTDVGLFYRDADEANLEDYRMYTAPALDT